MVVVELFIEVTIEEYEGRTEVVVFRSGALEVVLVTFGDRELTVVVTVKLDVSEATVEVTTLEEEVTKAEVVVELNVVSTTGTDGRIVADVTFRIEEGGTSGT